MPAPKPIVLRIRNWGACFAFVLLSACGGGGGGGDQTGGTFLSPAYSGTGLGLLVAADVGSTVSVWPGEKIARRVVLAKAVAGIRAELSLETPSSTLQLAQSGDGGTLTIDATGLASGTQIDATVVAKNLDNGTSERLAIAVKVLTPAVVASGSLTSSGGAVSSPGGAIGLQANPGQLGAPVGVTIRTASLPNGATRIRVQFNRDVSAETGIVTLISNQAAATTQSTAREQALGGTLRERPLALSKEPYPMGTTIQNYPGYFLERKDFRLASVTNSLGTISKWSCDDGQTTSGICLDLDPSASRLTSSRTIEQLVALRDGQVTGGAAVVPVLFVHGYENEFGADLGGGAGTWNDFPQLVADLSGSEKVYVPFEFQWRTNASFSVVADELAQALIRIRNLTGRPVRIIAHSFGGLLVRTLLQRLAANQKDFDPAHVHSVLTLGTPHSGIFAAATTVQGEALPVGRDGTLMDKCGQVSCYDAGAGEGILGIDWGTSPVEMKKLTAAGSVEGGLVAALARVGLPTGLPFVVGIGLKREDGSHSTYDSGDGLISFLGQRFDPGVAEKDLLYDCNSPVGGLVKEVVLKYGTQDLAIRTGSTAIELGYSHIGDLPVLELKMEPHDGIELGEPYVSCKDVSTCNHASFTLFQETLKDPAQYCDARVTAPLPASVSLIGSNVTLTADYPTLGTHVTVPNTQTIGEGIEYLSGSLQLLNFANIIGSNVDVGASTIGITYTQTATAAFGTFNGLVFDFDPASPRITNAQLDPLSSFNASQVTVTFDAHRVAFSTPGLFIPNGSRILITLTLATP